jgi:two-component sensor histidine kinase
LALLESQSMAQRAIIRALAAEHRHREYAAASQRGIGQTLADAAIREGHRRIRNTIQIAASLLSLQARASPCAQVRSILQERYGRLRLLDKVHELLYASAVSTQEIVMPALLQAVGDALRQSFAEVSGRVRLKVTSDTIVLSADEAIPMALLANEVVTNAYKHAFPQSRAGEIAINLRCAAENALVLQVRDNGIGMRPSSGERGLGLKLVRTCAAQLRGTLSVAQPVDAAGTTVTLVLNRLAQRKH